MSDNIIDKWEEEITESAELEALGEICLYRDNEYSLHFDPTDKQTKGFSLNPYVKIYDDGSYIKAKSDIRTDLDDGHLSSHKDGKKDLKMNDKLAKKTEDIINNGICNTGSYKGEKVIDVINKALKEKYDKNCLYIDNVDFSNYYSGKKK